MIRIDRRPIEEVLRELPALWKPGAAGSVRGRGEVEGVVGAWLEFYGIVRDQETTEAGTEAIRAIDYEAHPEMAEHQIGKILDKLAEIYPLAAFLVIHRDGPVPVGESSLLVRILSPHRTEALQACAEFIDELKTWVPIWKHPVPGGSEAR